MNRVNITKGAVTFLDVLGWKGIWERHNDAADRLYSLVKEIEDKATHFDEVAGNENKEMRGIRTTVLSISDTIAIFTPGEPKGSLKIHAELCKHAIPESVRRLIPLRGATCYGEFSIKENIMVGPAVDEAASWHEDTDWIGVFLTPSALYSIEDLPCGWINYSPPFKSKGFGLTGCVDWKFNITEKSLEEIFYDMGPLIPEIASKYSNTLKFLKRDKK